MSNIFIFQSNRYPLHYAYALPADQAKGFIRLLLGKDAHEIENRVDKVRRCYIFFIMLSLETNVQCMKMSLKKNKVEMFMNKSLIH